MTTDITPITPTQAIADIGLAMDTDVPVLVLGSPGVGKSDIARHVAAQRGGGFIEMSVTYLDAVDIHGLPTVDKESMTARWVPMGMLPTAERDGETGTLFIDEITNADQSVKAALYSLILDRKVGEYQMPAGWRIIAAGNRVQDRAAATPMPSALSARFSQMTIEPVVDDWVKWAINEKLHPVFPSFMRLRPDLLNAFDPAQTVNPIPRTWGFAAKFFMAAGENPSSEVWASTCRLIRGVVGDAAATEFLAFCSMWRSMPNPDQILMNPEGAIVPEQSDARFCISGALAHRVTDRTFDNMITYLKRLPGEFGVRTIRDATTRDPELCNNDTYLKWVQDNEDLYM